MKLNSEHKPQLVTACEMLMALKPVSAKRHMAKHNISREEVESFLGYYLYPHQLRIYMSDLDAIDLES